MLIPVQGGPGQLEGAAQAEGRGCPEVLEAGQSGDVGRVLRQLRFQLVQRTELPKIENTKVRIPKFKKNPVHCENSDGSLENQVVYLVQRNFSRYTSKPGKVSSYM